MKNKKFCVLFATSNYYEMFKDCQYKYTRANHNDVVVLNVDINSTTENKENGKQICKDLGIHFVNPNKNYTSCQESVSAADEYLIENDINVEWILCFQHDVIPMESNFWDRLDEHLELVEEHKDKVGMFCPNSIMDYNIAKETINSENVIERRKTGTRTGRGNLQEGILNPPYSGWYKALPDEYYLQDYFVVESPYWTCVGFNRKLFRENIEVDTDFEFELWPDDIAHQFLKKGFIHIAFPDLMVCHDHILKQDIKVNTINRDSDKDHGDFCKEQMKFLDKHHFRWGVRNSELRKQFWNAKDKYKDTIQRKLFFMDINDGPRKIEDFV